MSEVFKFEMGQEVWFIDHSSKATTGKITRRTIEESADCARIAYSMDEASDKPEHRLFESAQALTADFFSNTTVEYSIKTPDGETLDNYRKLHDLCGYFIDDNVIKDEEMIRCTPAARKLIKDICKLIGYYEGDKEA